MNIFLREVHILFYNYHHIIFSTLTAYSDPTATLFYYIDLKKTIDDLPGTWKWGDGTSLNYDRWDDEQPDDLIKKEACIKKTSQLMRDSAGDKHYHFICEK